MKYCSKTLTEKLTVVLDLRATHGFLIRPFVPLRGHIWPSVQGMRGVALSSSIVPAESAPMPYCTLPACCTPLPLAALRHPHYTTICYISFLQTRCRTTFVGGSRRQCSGCVCVSSHHSNVVLLSLLVCPTEGRPLRRRPQPMVARNNSFSFRPCLASSGAGKQDSRYSDSSNASSCRPSQRLRPAPPVPERNVIFIKRVCPLPGTPIDCPAL